MKVYVEVTKRRTFAVAVDWPGWARSGKTEDEALGALLAYGSRYKASMGTSAAQLKVAASPNGLTVIERLTGNATTEFGAPGVIPDGDREKASDKELAVLVDLLKASWRAFDRTVKKAEGKQLAPSGPRGGGRALAKIVEHVAGAEAGYTNALGGRARESDAWPDIQAAFVESLRARNAGELPDRGPRGGERWPARFAVRRSAWHALDHAWEIEDRAG